MPRVTRMLASPLKIETKGLGSGPPSQTGLPTVLDLIREGLSPKERPALSIRLPRVDQDSARARVPSEPATPATPMSPLSATVRQIWRTVVETPRSLLRRNRAAAWNRSHAANLPRVIPAEPERHTVPGLDRPGATPRDCPGATPRDRRRSLHDAPPPHLAPPPQRAPPPDPEPAPATSLSLEVCDSPAPAPTPAPAPPAPALDPCARTLDRRVQSCGNALTASEDLPTFTASVAASAPAPTRPVARRRRPAPLFFRRHTVPANVDREVCPAEPPAAPAKAAGRVRRFQDFLARRTTASAAPADDADVPQSPVFRYLRSWAKSPKKSARYESDEPEAGPSAADLELARAANAARPDTRRARNRTGDVDLDPPAMIL